MNWQALTARGIDRPVRKQCPTLFGRTGKGHGLRLLSCLYPAGPFMSTKAGKNGRLLHF
ncbi:hypothetical protein R69888_03952 [Paraburkholderia haematera]|uniref:Uncharacterized protein n=1 Tax=Paraburkholderia haematera TaxID=2793077 RepID=A0ABN7LWM6_9BURK|nr:hypothetical protein R69888_03952 [Paraburkholderia haematera]